MSTTVFFSYSHKDKALRDQLSEHLSGLRRNRMIEEWYDGKIIPGSRWADEIYRNLNTADIILLLISASFIDSEYCWSKELMQAMQRHNAGEACVIPVILESVDWRDTPFSELQALPENSHPVTSWPNQNEALTDVAKGVRRAVNQMAQQKQKRRASPQIPQEPPLPMNDSEMQQIRESGRGEFYYREEVIHCAREDGGEISDMSRVFLDCLRSSLAISPEQATEIEQEELHPFQVYAQTLTGMARRQYPLTEATRAKLRRLQDTLLLSDEDVVAIHQKVAVSMDTQHNPIAESHPLSEDDLRSERGIDYRPLRDTLRAEKWREADQETHRIMCRVIGQEHDSSLLTVPVEAIQQFPCQDLQTIDQLWVSYSNGRFGFSVQREIWRACGSPEVYSDDWLRFGDAVGWRKDNKWNIYTDAIFDISAPIGHLPDGDDCYCAELSASLFIRLDACEL